MLRKLHVRLAMPLAKSYRWGGALPVAALLLATCGADTASANTLGTLTYTGFSQPAGSDPVTVSSSISPTISGLAGQIQLSGVTLTGNTGLVLGPGSTILAWCVDINDILQSSSTYTVQTPQQTPNSSPLPNITGGQILEMGGLMQEGNKLIAAGSSLTLTNLTTKLPFTAGLADISAATQIAIWSEEYPGFQYTVTSGLGSGAAGTNFASLVSYLESNETGNSSWDLLVGASTWDPKTKQWTSNQNLGSLDPVPGPVAGGGLPAMVLASLGLLFWRRRATRAVATTG
jgi:hypothetical protein